MLTFCLALFLLVCFDLNTNMVLSAFTGTRSKHFVIHLESSSLDSRLGSPLDYKVSSPSRQKLDLGQSPTNTVLYRSHNRRNTTNFLSQNISRRLPIMRGRHSWTRKTGRRSFTWRTGKRLAGITRDTGAASTEQISDNHGPALLRHLVKRQTESITPDCGSLGNRCAGISLRHCVRMCINNVMNVRVCKVDRQGTIGCVVFSHHR
ncbi:uncharacterized protein LOC131950388 [Physella acuta]|uniref:uncharacterized protein LOC131950388 n=1 Tax=Physella acuta TaxID=109671 RepID=UPI0027DBE0E4|nr:uncharacterized protein LOC131950388 [Physella acuta]XP_059168480.1 uncharacterized protein LOC131950388 [Physella acuta]XP_059168481.1 uncharacterized protein LOC131950388 [Physella acuta]